VFDSDEIRLDARNIAIPSKFIKKQTGATTHVENASRFGRGAQNLGNPSQNE
jgi:hypothetical protein